MSTSVMLLVLVGALLHASWNAIVKSGGDKLHEAALVAGGASVVALLAAPFLPTPDPASMPWLIASVIVHQPYYILVAAAYRAGDMGHTYPLMRGSAPLIVALVSGPLIGEALSLGAWTGILLICGGILLLALHRHANPAATRLAFANAFVIALYTVVDGMGARASGAAVSYLLWLTVFTSPPLLLWLYVTERQRLMNNISHRAGIGLLGGACSVGSYSLALWAMTKAPLASVAALRETSVLFGVGLSILALGESSGMRRLAAALLVVAGAIALRFS